MCFTIWSYIKKSEIGNSTKWAIKRYEYREDGRLFKTKSPLDYQVGNDDFSTTTHYNRHRGVYAKYRKGRGLEKYFTNNSGQVILKQDEGQRKKNTFTYLSYDFQGRLVEEGEAFLTPGEKHLEKPDEFKLEIIESGIFSKKTPYKKYIYDRIEKFQAMTGVSHLELVPGLELKNGYGKMVAAINFNPLIQSSELTGIKSWVVDFYSYNDEGLADKSFHYVGAMENNVWVYENTFDLLSRAQTTKSYSLNNPNEAKTVRYRYNNKGQVSDILWNNSIIMTYNYREDGQVRRQWTGISQVIATEFKDHILGGIEQIKTTSTAGGLLFEQQLKYDVVVPENNLPTPQAYHDGRISQNRMLIQKLNNTTLNRLYQYNYDDQKRLNESEAFDYNGSNYDFMAGLSNYFIFDANGRTTHQALNNEFINSSEYHYESGSYKLDHLSGPDLVDGRDLNSTKTLIWDASGNMIADASKNMTSRYDYSGKSVEFCRNLPEGNFCELQIYNASGSRVSRVEVQRESLRQKVFFIGTPNEGEEIAFDFPDFNTAMPGVKSKVPSEWNHALGPWAQMYYIYNQSQKVEASQQVIKALKNTQNENVGLRIEAVKRNTPRYFEILTGFNQTVTTLAEHTPIPEVRIYETHENETISTSKEWNLVTGSGVIGREINGVKEYFITNHQGSVVLTVDAQGMVSAGNSALDYSVNGVQQDLLVGNNPELKNTYTGKPFDKNMGVYYYGARHFDPVLGIWLTPDPARQFHNPYGFGGDMINFVDPDGRIMGGCGRHCPQGVGGGGSSMAGPSGGAGGGVYLGSEYVQATGNTAHHYSYNDEYYEVYNDGHGVIDGSFYYVNSYPPGYTESIEMINGAYVLNIRSPTEGYPSFLQNGNIGIASSYTSKGFATSNASDGYGMGGALKLTSGKAPAYSGTSRNSVPPVMGTALSAGGFGATNVADDVLQGMAGDAGSYRNTMKIVDDMLEGAKGWPKPKFLKGPGGGRKFASALRGRIGSDLVEARSSARLLKVGSRFGTGALFGVGVGLDVWLDQQFTNNPWQRSVITSLTAGAAGAVTVALAVGTGPITVPALLGGVLVSYGAGQLSGYIFDKSAGVNDWNNVLWR